MHAPNILNTIYIVGTVCLGFMRGFIIDMKPLRRISCPAWSENTSPALLNDSEITMNKTNI